MKLLLDAHTFLWFVWDDAQLTNNARALIVNPANQKFISTATYWEIAIKVSIGKLDLGEPYRAFIHREIARNNFDLLPVSVDHAAAVSVLPFHHRDPFDRMLIAQAMVEQLPIVSGDSAFEAYPITQLW
jgi:PIN domain nuclease of toxin-antitoxin system